MSCSCQNPKAPVLTKAQKLVALARAATQLEKRAQAALRAKQPAVARRLLADAEALDMAAVDLLAAEPNEALMPPGGGRTAGPMATLVFEFPSEGNASGFEKIAKSRVGDSNVQRAGTNGGRPLVSAHVDLMEDPTGGRDPRARETEDRRWAMIKQLVGFAKHQGGRLVSSSPQLNL